MGFYMDTRAAKDMLGNDFGCLPPVSLEHNQTLAERMHLSFHALLMEYAQIQMQDAGPNRLTEGSCCWY